MTVALLLSLSLVASGAPALEMPAPADAVVVAAVEASEASSPLSLVVGLDEVYLRDLSSCPSCGAIEASGCTEGQSRWIYVGGCCPDGGRDKWTQVCENGSWVTTSVQYCFWSSSCPYQP